MRDRRIEREHVHALARCVGQHRAAAINDVARRDLVAARLEDVRHHVLAVAGGIALQDGKNRADRDVGVDIARTIKRVEQHDVFAGFRLLNHVRLLVFLRHQDANIAAIPEAPHQRLIGKLIQLLNFLALDVDPAGRAHDFEQASPLDVGGDDFGRQRDA